MGESTKKLSVIILNWNGKELLKRFLPSVVEHSREDYAEVVVADNGSTDGSKEMLNEEFPSVRIIPFAENYGFAGGYNRAVESVDSEFVLLLNSDVEVSEGWLRPLYNYITTHDDVAAVQPKILSYNERDRFEYAGASGGFIDRFGFPFCRGRIVGSDERDEGQYDDIADLFWCSGAAMLVKRSLYIEAGGLDESFFAHQEEIDLSWRMHALGFRSVSCPESVVWHLGGGTLPMDHPGKLMLNYRNNLLMLYKNLTKGSFRRVLFCRFFMDFAASLLFLLRGEFKNFCTVFKAYHSFFTMRRGVKRVGEGASTMKMAMIYPRSIIVAYYLKRVKSFSHLPYKLCDATFVKITANDRR